MDEKQEEAAEKRKEGARQQTKLAARFAKVAKTKAPVKNATGNDKAKFSEKKV